MKLDGDLKNRIRKGIQLLGDRELHDNLLGTIPMEIIVRPSESFFQFLISIKVNYRDILETISVLYSTILEEINLRIYDVP